MFFEDEKENLENIDDLDLDLDDDIEDDDSISWDELLKDSSSDTDIVSINPNKDVQGQKSQTKVVTESDDEIDDNSESLTLEDDEFMSEDIDLDDDNTEDIPPKKDAFDVFGGKDEADNLEDVDNEMDEDTQGILNELDNMEDLDAALETEEAEEQTIGIKQDEKQINVPVVAGAVFAAVLVLGSLLFMFMGPKKTDVDVVQNVQMQNETQTQTQEQEQLDAQMQNENAEQIPVVDDKSAKNLKPDKKVVVAVESAGRVNPFLPTFDDFNSNYYAGIPSQILMPPDKYGNDTDAQELLKVAVSGILFDNVKPSAIITISGVDYFVQKGDMVDDYLVMDINRQFVVVKKGTNIYKAGVGERFSQNAQINGAAVYGAGGVRQYKRVTDEHTSASDVEVVPVD